MLAFFVRRFAQSLVALVFLSVVVFLIGHATGDPTYLLVASDASESQRLQVRESLGLDKPLPDQYMIWASNLLHGDMGTSLRSREDVSTLILGRLPASTSLAVAAMGLILAVGIPLGVVSAVWRGTAVDAGAKGFAVLAQSVPSFLVGIALVQLLAVNLGWFPASGRAGLMSYVLPVLTLGHFVLAGVIRLVRTSMLEVLDSEFVKLARSKGLSEFDVIVKHALRNALIPVVTFAGLQFSVLVTLAIVVEVIFAWPGVGQLTYSSIIFRDFPVLQGVVLMTAVIVMSVNLGVDLLYATIDPRIRIGERT